MTQENKELVLKDLCARLPDKVIVDYAYNAFDVRKGNHVKHGSKCILNCYLLDVFISPRQNEKGEYIKPYLFPLSSMTEEQKKEYRKVCELDTEILSKHPMDETPFPALYNSQDWLNENHFDYRGLIEKGLAVEAPEGMYNF